MVFLQAHLLFAQCCDNSIPVAWLYTCTHLRISKSMITSDGKCDLWSCLCSIFPPPPPAQHPPFCSLPTTPSLVYPPPPPTPFTCTPHLFNLNTVWVKSARSFNAKSIVGGSSAALCWPCRQPNCTSAYDCPYWQPNCTSAYDGPVGNQTVHHPMAGLAGNQTVLHPTTSPLCLRVRRQSWSKSPRCGVQWHYLVNGHAAKAVPFLILTVHCWPLGIKIVTWNSLRSSPKRSWFLLLWPWFSIVSAVTVTGKHTLTLTYTKVTYTLHNTHTGWRTHECPHLLLPQHTHEHTHRPYAQR